MLSFTVPDINTTVSKLMALGAELDGPIKYEIHGKVISLYMNINFILILFVSPSMYFYDIIIFLGSHVPFYAGCSLTMHRRAHVGSL